MENGNMGTQIDRLLLLGQRIWLPIKDRFFNDAIDRRQKVMTTSVPFLFVVLFFVLFKVLYAPSPNAAKAQTSPDAETFTPAYEKTNWELPVPYPQGLRDPMQYGSITSAKSDFDGLAVKAIVFSEDKPSAVINGKIVRQGDIVSGATIIKINRNNIEFEFEGKRWTRRVQ